MRYLKMIALAAAAASIATAAFGPSSALAVDQEVVLCTLNVLLCPNETEIYNSGQLFLTKGGKTSFSGTLSETCGSTDFHGETLASMGAPLLVDVTNLTFAEACEPCSSVVANTKSTDGKISMDEKSGLFLLTFPIEIVFSNCPLGAECTFSAKPVTLEGENGEASAEVFAKEKEFVLTKGSSILCGTNCKWNATYTMSEPNPVYFSLYKLS